MNGNGVLINVVVVLVLAVLMYKQRPTHRLELAPLPVEERLEIPSNIVLSEN
jgi:hypothetical protein